MSTEPDNANQEAPQWMREVFEELKDMFEGLFSDADESIGLFPDADKLNLEEMQRHLNERQAQQP
jgi:hypothetical protein